MNVGTGDNQKRPFTCCEDSMSPDSAVPMSRRESTKFMAGYMDASAEIRIEFVERKGLPVYTLFMYIPGMTEDLKWMQRNFSAAFTRKGKTVVCKGSISEGRWNTKSRLAAHVLRQVLQFLTTKSEQARVAIAFQDHMDDRQFEKNRRPLTAEMIIWREEMKDDVERLNPRIQRVKEQRAIRAARGVR